MSASWLRDAVFYEIYPQSFRDSNGDGIGDLPGITEKLPYVKSLGCNALWINPCFDSPFKDAGYDAVIVTDHYTPEFFPDNQRNYAQRLHDYFEGYRCAQAEGDRIGLHVFPALEVRTAAGMEDYLIYGVTPEELERIGCLAHLSLPELREAGHSVPDAILVQAHPYRGYLHCMPAGLLDGVEVCNENPRHNSHNDRALAYAKEHHLLMTAGSDVHELGDAGGAGLLCPAFSDIKAFARHVRDGQTLWFQSR